MTVRLLSVSELLDATATSLGAPTGEALSPFVLTQAIRRTAFIVAPVRRHELARAVLRALRPLGDEHLNLRIDDAIEDLVALGEILEMSADGEAQNVVLRTAPPTFVRRADGDCVLLGVAGDDITPPLPDDLALGVSGGVRLLSGADAPEKLRDLGLNELSEHEWLHQPTSESAIEYLKGWRQRLDAAPPCGTIAELEILDSARPNYYYNGRWTPPAKHTGLYVARRPKRFGADFWCLAELAHGTLKRFVDITPQSPRAHPRDEAYRLQAALDAVGGKPQQVSVVSVDGEYVLGLFAPPPSWLARRLMLKGRPTTSRGALVAYAMPPSAAEIEIKALADLMWCSRREEQGS